MTYTPNPTDGFIPLKDDGVNIDSALQETSTEIISSKTIQVPPESLVVGRNVTLSDAGGFLSALAQAFDNDQTFYTQNSVFMTQEEYDNAEQGDGIIKPSRFNILPTRWQDTIPFEFQTNATSSITFPYVTETNLVVNQIRLRFDQPVNNVRLKIERLQEDFSTWKVVWENVQDTVWLSGSGGYNFTAGENTQSLPLVNLGRSQEIFRATLETTESILPINGVVTDLGLGSAFYPFLMIDAQDWFFTDVPNDYDTTQDNFGKFAEQTNLNTIDKATVRDEGDERDGIDGQSDDSTDTIYRRDWGFTFTSTDTDITLQSLTFKSLDSHTNVLFTVDNESTSTIDAEPAFNTLDVVVGDNTITFPQEVLIKTGETFTISLFAFDGNNDTDQGVRLKAFNNTSFPFFSYRVKPVSTENIATENWVDDNYAEEAPDDGRSYIRNSKDWISTEYTHFNDATIYTTSNDFNTLPVTVLDEDVTLEGGVYEITHSFSAWCTATNRQVNVDFRIDDVRVGQVYTKESKDTSDINQPSKTIAKTLTAGTYNFKTEFGRTGGGGGSVVSISDICLTIERKLP